jgi:hypothetical protein
MSDPLITAERYRKEAAEFSELAKTAETSFIRDYYGRLAQRYLMHAENQEKLARVSEGFATDRHQDDQIADSPSVQVTAGVVLPEEASASDRSASQEPLQPTQGPPDVPRQIRRRRPARGSRRPGGQG